MSNVCLLPLFSRSCLTSLSKNAAAGQLATTARHGLHGSIRCITSFARQQNHASNRTDRLSRPTSTSFKRGLDPQAQSFSTSLPLSKRSPRNAPTTRGSAGSNEPRIRVPFGAQSRAQLASIFNQSDIAYEDGNKILRILHQRRVIGSLVDKGVQITGNHNVKTESLESALDWLRKKYPVDEQAAAEIWAEEEAERLEGTYIARAEKLGLYKPLEGEEENEAAPKSIYGVSVLDEYKKYREEREAREAKEKEESGETQRTQELALARREEREHKQALVEAKRRERQEKRALAGMVTPEEVPMPEITPGRRVLPSTLFGVSLIAFFWLAAATYAPPSQEQRLFPETPTAVATIGTLVAINLAVWAVWHVPVAWRQLNKYMVQAASAPYWPSVFGNIFSHQTITHFGANMACLVGYGLTLHEDIGRANFVALYLSGGIVGSLASLYYHVFSKNLIYYTFGASGAVWATMIAWGLLTLSKPAAPPDSWYFAADASRYAIILFQLLAHFAPGISQRIDVFSHIGGAFTGGIAAWYLKSKAAQRRQENGEDAERQSGQDSAGSAFGLDGSKAA